MCGIKMQLVSIFIEYNKTAKRDKALLLCPSTFQNDLTEINRNKS